MQVADIECPRTFILRPEIQQEASAMAVMESWFNQAMAVRAHCQAIPVHAYDSMLRGSAICTRTTHPLTALSAWLAGVHKHRRRGICCGTGRSFTRRHPFVRQLQALSCVRVDRGNPGEQEGSSSAVLSLLGWLGESIIHLSSGSPTLEPQKDTGGPELQRLIQNDVKRRLLMFLMSLLPLARARDTL